MTALLYTAFADTAAASSGGNVAGVILDGDGLDDAARQALARELDAPTTAFVSEARLLPAPSLTLRFFTPDREIEMCGHAVVAALTALVDEGRLDPGADGLALAVRTRSGTTSVGVHASQPSDADAPVRVEVALPAPRFRERTADRAAVEAALGGRATHPGLPLVVGGAGLMHLFVPFPHVADLAALSPDHEELAALGRGLDVDTISTFAAETEPDGAWRMRDFCAPIGKSEESASGTTSGALCAYLVRCGLLAADRSVEIEVRQGVEMGAPSRIRVRHEPASTGAVRLSVFGSGRALAALAGRQEEEA